MPSASPRNRGTGTHGGAPLPVPTDCLAPAAPALPTLQPPGSNWIQVFIADPGNTGRWPRGHGERGPSLPAARLSPRAVCSAPRAMGRQTRPCRREQNQGKQRLVQPRRAEFGASQGPSSLGMREHSSEHSLHGPPVPPCPRRVVAGPWTWEAPAAPRVLGPKQRPEVKVLNVPCWHDPGGGLGGTLPGRAEHPHFSSWHLLGTLRTHPLRLHPWIHSHLSRGTPKYLLIPPRPRRLGSPCHASTDPDGRAVAPGACPGCIRAPASPGPPLPSGSRPEKCSLRGLIATQRCVCR